MKLISMTDFVLEQMNMISIHHEDDSDCLRYIENYAKFLKQPLKLEMFVPCDDEGNVLEEPDITEEKYSEKNITWLESDILYDKDMRKYRQAKEKVLFEGFSVKNEDKYHVFSFKGFPTWLTWTNRVVEDLLNNEYIELTITESAKKQIGL